MKTKKNLSPAPPKYQQEVKVEEEEEGIQEEEEDEVEEAEGPALEEPNDPSYPETLKTEIIQITSRHQMVNYKDHHMDTHFVTIVEELATKGNIAQ
jgi:hypothetical protein